ncbi:hypothetical protein [Corynebacterium efficiens]|nr:hypothetical protein [Corynebacterium efficiens]
MLKKSSRTVMAVAVGVATLLLAPARADAAVAGMLNQLPSGEISCATASAYWTNDADYQARVGQAQAIAALDPRGNEILAALGRVDAAAERCGLKGTAGTGGGVPDAPADAPAGGGAAQPGGAAEQPGGGQGGAAGGAGNGAGQPAGGGVSPGNPGGAAGTAGDGAGAVTPPSAGSGGTPDAPVTDAEAVLGPIRGNPGTPMKTIEILGQGQVEVADADAMMSNFLRQFTIVL